MAEGNVSSTFVVEDDDSPDKAIWCLKRVGKNYDWLRLFENTEITLGRGLNVTYQVLSPSCPLMISRNHCSFKQTDDGQWTVTDKKSLNGVWVNGERILADKAWPLSCGDSIKLGVPVNSTQVEFEYILVQDCMRTLKPFFCSSLAAEATTDIKTKTTKRKLHTEDSESSTTPQSKSKLYRYSSADKSLGWSCPVEKRSRQGPKDAEAAGTSGERSQPASRSSSELACLQRYNQNMQALKKKLLFTEQQVASLQELIPVPQEELYTLQEQLVALRGQLRCQREQQLRRVEKLEQSFYEEEKRLEMEKRQQQEESLKKQLEEALLEHRKVIEELKHSRQGFEEILQAKDKELEETKEEKEKARAQKEEVVTQMTEVLENELQCIICSELFIEAVTLNCAHSFCLHCIGEWRKRKDECPICRQGILSQTRSLVLDNCIDRMVDNLSSEMKQRRQELIGERKALPVVVVMIHDEDSYCSTSSLDSSSDISFESSYISDISQSESSLSWGSDSSSFSDSSFSDIV